MSGITTLIIVGAVMFSVLGGITLLAYVYSLNNIKSSLRIIPLSDYLIDICNQWTWMAPEAYVLTGDLDRFVEPRTLQYRLAKYTKDCNLDGVHYHVLRHTFATRCVEVDFEIKSLSEVLGHSSPRITLERYVHSSMELKRDNMKKLSAIGY